jgi:hypothetical protein
MSEKRTAEGQFVRRGWRKHPPLPSPGDAGDKLLLCSGRRMMPVFVVDGRVNAVGTSPECRRLIGLSVAALHAYAAGRGWKVVAAPARTNVLPEGL